ncbi:MAG: hypothetical protein ACLUNQ_06255 [Oscillospiraceae bacterium]
MIRPCCAVSGAESGPPPRSCRPTTMPLCAAYRRDYSGDTPVLHRMRELWTYLSGSFRDTDTFLRAVRKTRTLSAYDQAARAFFAQARLSEE